MFRFILAFFSLAVLVSCQKENITPSEPLPPLSLVNDTSGYIVLNFKNVVGSQDLVLSTQNYINQNLDTFKVDIYKYYVTNIELKTADGYVFKETESYHLINQADASSHTFTVNGIPKGNYTSISFLIGVDKDRNTSGAQTGALDPANGMFWTWSSGYIMSKLEGTSPQSSDLGKKITYHIAGFSGANNVLRSPTLTFTTSAIVSKTQHSKVNINCDVLEWFKAPNLISFSTINNVTTVSPEAKQIADNYVDMFKVTSIENH
jgi:hypothetical protein